MTRLIESSDRGVLTPALIEQTIGEFFATVVQRWPNQAALVSRHQDLRFTYRELDRESHRLGSALLRVGLVAGDRVGVWAHNCHEWLLMQIATAKAGIILVNINPAYRVTELEYALNKVGCKMLVTMTAYKTSNYIGIVRELAPEVQQSKPGQQLLESGDPDDPALHKAGALHDRDQPRKLPKQYADATGQARIHGGYGAAASGHKSHRPGHWQSPSHRSDWRVLHSGLSGHARLWGDEKKAGGHRP